MTCKSPRNCALSPQKCPPLANSLKSMNAQSPARSLIHLAALLGAVAMLASGCATSRGRYACGAPQGVTCMSAREVYEHTNDADRVLPQRRGQDAHRSGAAQDIEYGAPTRTQDTATSVVIDRGALTFAHTQNPNAGILPGGAVITGPVRTPPKVMRIWVNAWEDQAGDLHEATAVYTEIQPRRWSIGERQTPAAQTLRLIEPLSGTTTARANPAPAPTAFTPPPQASASDDRGG